MTRYIVYLWVSTARQGASGLGIKAQREVMAVFAGHERRALKERQRHGQAAKRAAGVPSRSITAAVQARHGLRVSPVTTAKVLKREAA